MPITKTITLYKFDELPTEKAKEAARNWWRETDYDWDEGVREDARQVGIQITGFDIDRGSYCRIDFVDGAFNAAVAIRANHGEQCDTYKAAVAYEAATDKLTDEVTNLEEEQRNAEAADAIETEFMKALGGCYLRMLREEYDYRGSAEYIDETLEANEYTFTETGEREDA